VVKNFKKAAMPLRRRG